MVHPRSRALRSEKKKPVMGPYNSMKDACRVQDRRQTRCSEHTASSHVEEILETARRPTVTEDRGSLGAGEREEQMGQMTKGHKETFGVIGSVS